MIIKIKEYITEPNIENRIKANTIDNLLTFNGKVGESIMFNKSLLFKRVNFEISKFLTISPYIIFKISTSLFNRISSSKPLAR